MVVVGIEGAADIHEVPRDDALQQGALIGAGAHLVRLALALVDVAFGAGDVEVATEDHQALVAGGLGGERIKRVEKPQLGLVILAAVRHVDRRQHDLADGRRDGGAGDSLLEVERGMHAHGRCVDQRLRHQ